MVVFDQNGIIQPVSMVMTATSFDGIFLESSEAWKRFAGAADTGFCVGDLVNNLTGDLCNSP